MELSCLPNISKVLEGKLKQINISNVSELKSEGSKTVFVKLRIADPSCCLNMLYAIEGAVQNIRWHNLDADTKNDLKNFYKTITFKHIKNETNCK